jgi:protease-4
MSFLRLGAVAMLDAVGLSATAERLQETGLVQSVDRMSMDGLLALWQPASSN